MEELILSLTNINALTNALSSVFWAILVFFIGLFLSKKIGKIAQNLLDNIRLNQAAKNLGWHQFFEKYNTKLNASSFFGLIVQIYGLLITLMVSTEILSLTILSKFFLNIVEYYPNILISSVIFIMAVFVAEFSKKIVYAESDLKYSNTLSVFIGASIWILAMLAIFYQLKIVPELIITLFIGVVAALSLTFGISFGLGGQDLVKNFLKKIEKKIK